MPEKPRGGSPAAQRIEPPQFTLRDLIMLLLALVSVFLVLADIFFRHLLYGLNVFGAVVLVDFLITLVFLAEFVWKVERGHAFLRIVRSNWFELLGMVPLAAFVMLEAVVRGVPIVPALTGQAQLLGGATASAGALLRLFRFVRIIRIVQAISRFLRATNMTFGEATTKRVFDKYRRIIVAELTTPIMVAGITVSQELIIRMKFLESAGQAIDSKRAEVHAAVLESLERNHIPQSVLTKPLVDRIIHDVERTVVNTVVETLTGPELNKLTQETIVEVLENFKTQLESPEGRQILKNMGAAPADEQPLPGAPR